MAETTINAVRAGMIRVQADISIRQCPSMRSTEPARHRDAPRYPLFNPNAAFVSTNYSDREQPAHPRRSRAAFWAIHWFGAKNPGLLHSCPLHSRRASLAKDT
jgi:hypothetical protein